MSQIPNKLTNKMCKSPKNINNYQNMKQTQDKIDYENLSTNCTVVGSNNLNLVKKPMHSTHAQIVTSMSPAYSNPSPGYPPSPYSSPASLKSPSPSLIKPPTPQPPTFPMMQIINNPLIARPIQQHQNHQQNVIKLKPHLNILPKPSGSPQQQSPKPSVSPQIVIPTSPQATLMPSAQPLLLNQMPMLAAPGVQFILRPQTATKMPTQVQTASPHQGLILQSGPGGQQLLQLQPSRNQPMVRVLTNSVQLAPSNATFMTQTPVSVSQQQQVQNMTQNNALKKKPKAKVKKKLDLANIMKLSGIGDEDDIQFESDASQSESEHNSVPTTPQPAQQTNNSGNTADKNHKIGNIQISQISQPTINTATPVVQVLNQNFQSGMISNNTSQASTFSPFITPNFTINNGLMVQRSGGFKLTVGEDGRLVLQHDPNLNQDLQSQLILQSIFGLNGGLVLQPSLDQQTIQTIQQQSVQTIQQQTIQSQTIQTVQQSVQHQTVQSQPMIQPQMQIIQQPTTNLASIQQQLQNIMQQQQNIQVQGQNIQVQGQNIQIQQNQQQQGQIQGQNIQLQSQNIQLQQNNDHQSIQNQLQHLQQTLQNQAIIQGQNVNLQGQSINLQNIQGQSINLQGQSLQGQNLNIQGQNVNIQGQNLNIQGQSINLQGQNLQGQSINLQGQNLQGQSINLQGQSLQGQNLNIQGHNVQLQNIQGQLQGQGQASVNIQGQSVNIQGQAMNIQGLQSQAQSMTLQGQALNVQGQSIQLQGQTMTSQGQIMSQSCENVLRTPTSHVTSLAPSMQMQNMVSQSQQSPIVHSVQQSGQNMQNSNLKQQQIKLQHLQSPILLPTSNITSNQHGGSHSITTTSGITHTQPVLKVQPFQKSQLPVQTVQPIQSNKVFNSNFESNSTQNTQQVAPTSYVVNLTPDQLEQLKRNGQLTVNGQTIFMQRPNQNNVKGDCGGDKKISPKIRPLKKVVNPPKSSPNVKNISAILNDDKNMKKEVKNAAPVKTTQLVQPTTIVPTTQQQKTQKEPPVVMAKAIKSEDSVDKLLGQLLEENANINIITSATQTIPTPPPTQRIHTIQLTPQKQQCLKNIQQQIQTISNRLSQSNDTDLQNTLKLLFAEQQKILASGKLLSPDKVYYHNNQLTIVNPNVTTSGAVGAPQNMGLSPLSPVIKSELNAHVQNPVDSAAPAQVVTTQSLSLPRISTIVPSGGNNIQQQPTTNLQHSNVASSPQISSNTTNNQNSNIISNITRIKTEMPPPLSSTPTLTNILQNQQSLQHQQHLQQQQQLQKQQEERSTIARKTHLIEAQLNLDQNGAVKPDIHTPFKDKKDACIRLIRYHVMDQPVLSEKDLEKADEIFELTAKHFIGKYDKMVDKYKYLLMKESMRHVQTSELMMLDRMFLSEEQQSLIKLRQEVEEAQFASICINDSNNMNITQQQQLRNMQQQHQFQKQQQQSKATKNDEDYDEWTCIQRELGCLTQQQQHNNTENQQQTTSKRTMSSDSRLESLKRFRVDKQLKQHSNNVVYQQQQQATMSNINNYSNSQNFAHFNHNLPSGGFSSSGGQLGGSGPPYVPCTTAIHDYKCFLPNSASGQSNISFNTSSGTENDELENNSIDEQVQSAIDSILNLQQSTALDLDSILS